MRDRELEEEEDIKKKNGILGKRSANANDKVGGGKKRKTKENEDTLTVSEDSEMVDEDSSFSKLDSNDRPSQERKPV
jgi:hypothetical protein